MSGEEEGGIANFLREGMDLFWNNPKNEVCFKDRGPSVEIMWFNKTKKNPLSWWKTHFAQKMPVGNASGKR